MHTEQSEVSEQITRTTRSERAYREWAPVAWRLPESLVERLNVNVTTFSAAIARKLPAIQRVRPAVLEALPEHDMLVFDALEDRTFALREADLLHDALPRSALVSPAMRALRGQLKVVGLEYTRLLGLGALTPGKHDPLVYTPSPVQLVSNTLTMTSHMRSAWHNIATQCVLDFAVFDALECAAEAVERAGSERKAQTAAIERASDLRNRIFTLVLQSIRNVRKAVCYLDKTKVGQYVPQFRNVRAG